MPPRARLDLVLMDANPTLRKGTELLLTSWGHRVIGAASDAASGCEAIRRRRPDLALVDLELPGGAEPVLRAATACGANVVLFLGSPGRHELDEALKGGALGLVLKSADPDELRQAVRTVGRGERYVAPAVEHLAARPRVSLGRVLTHREREVLQLLADGLTGKQASRHLAVSPETVRTHIRNAMRTLGARTRVRAVAIAVEQREIHL